MYVQKLQMSGSGFNYEIFVTLQSPTLPTGINREILISLILFFKSKISIEHMQNPNTTSGKLHLLLFLLAEEEEVGH